MRAITKKITSIMKNFDIFDVIVILALVCLLSYVLILAGVKYENFIIINNFIDSRVAD